MTKAELLRLLHDMEGPALKANDWEQLQVLVADLIARGQEHQASSKEIHALLEELRLEGELLFLPNWGRWNDLEGPGDGEFKESRKQWQPSQQPKAPSRERQSDLAQEMEPPTWSRRRVFLPRNLEHWFVRSRVAEVIRLLSANRERYGLETATAHVGYALQERRRPDRQGPKSVALQAVMARLQTLISNGDLSRASDPSNLSRAVGLVGTALGHALKTNTIAAFQERAWESILRALFDPHSPHQSTMVTAGVSSGKTFSFVLPALTLVVYRALRNEGKRPRVLVIYPRTSLVEDQYRVLKDLLAQINAELARVGLDTRVTGTVALDAGEMLAKSLDIQGSLAKVLPEVGERGIEIILTTPESLKNRMIDPRAVTTYLSHMELIVLDEIHLMEGLAGTHGIYFIRRLRHAVQSLRKPSDAELTWVGASATVSEPVKHAATVFSLSHKQVHHVAPREDELVRFGTFHHALIHTRVGKPSISALTNGVACLVHNRNDSTAHSHYVDPSTTPLQKRLTATIEKTLVFVDSLTTIGRLRFTTADNENCQNPSKLSPPYYAWFYQPASRHGATRDEEDRLGHGNLKLLREWCRKCHQGEPAEIPADLLKPDIFSNLRIGRNQIRVVPGFRRALEDLRGNVGNLDACPFLKARLCWWFSQDAGVRRPLARGKVSIWIDQNRAIAYTSKTEEELRLHDDVNDYFSVPPSEIWPPPFPSNDEQVVSTLLASPRIEVGVDFKKVRDGATHKALRSAASFQQKVGRVAREDETDSIIVTFLAHRPTDAHFAHQPSRLIDTTHLDPIPLKDENLDVLKHHLFAAALEWITSRPPADIPDAGREVNIIGTGSDPTASWDAKVRACITYLRDHHDEAREYLLKATVQGHERAHDADEAIQKLLQMLKLFITDLSGAYIHGKTPAHWFKRNERVYPVLEFEQAMTLWPQVCHSLDRLLPKLNSPVLDGARALRAELDKGNPMAQEVHVRAEALRQSAAQIVSGIPAALVGALFTLVGEVQQFAELLGKLQLSEELTRLREAHEIVKAFFQQNSDAERQRTQYYLHDLLTRLIPFRDYYPHVLVRTHFQHVSERQVKVLLARDQEDTEPIGIALYELLPGSWNYRWVFPRKSLSGRIDAHECGIRLDTIPYAIFEPTGIELPRDEVPLEMPGSMPGDSVPIYRPVRLNVRITNNQPQIRRDSRLAGDDDEASSLPDPRLIEECPTLPRASPATWYRVRPDPKALAVQGYGAPNQQLPHSFPALGRALLESITISSDFGLDRYVYALVRSYGNSIQSPRLHYRWGDKPVVLGDTFTRGTDALTLKLKPAVIEGVLEDALAQPYLRAELTARALYQFIIKITHCNPFQANMLRKVILAAHIDSSGTLRSLDAAACAAALGMGLADFDQHVAQLLAGVFAGVDAREIGDSRQRQKEWYDEVWPMMRELSTRAQEFNDALVRATARDILVHTFAVSSLEAIGRLVGATDRDLSYFFRVDRHEAYVFDTVEGGNGYTETAARFLHIPPLRRVVAKQSNLSGALPSTDGFTLLQEAMATCPAQIATRLLVETCLKGISDLKSVSFSDGPPEDLEARIRHEFDEISGSRPIVDHLFRSKPTLFASWQDLLWLELVPDWFAKELVEANRCANLESLRSRTHLCVTGCLECVDNGTNSVYGALASREHVSRNLLNLLKQHSIDGEPDSYLRFPIMSRASVEARIRRHASQPILDTNGAPLEATVPFQGGTQTLPVPRQRDTLEPTLGSADLLHPRQSNQWEVRIPLLASFRDEEPLP